MRARVAAVMTGTIAAAMVVAGCASAGTALHHSDVSSPAGSAGPAGSDGSTAVIAELSAGKAAMSKVKSATMSVTVNSAALTMKMNGSYVLTPQGFEGDFTVPAMASSGQTVGPMREIFMPGMFYLSMPQLTARSGKPWVSVSMDEVSTLSGLDLSSLIAQGQQTDPSQYITMLLASGDVHALGRETINGVATTHYSGTIDPTTAYSQFTGTVKDELKKLSSSLGVSTIDIDLWVDDQNLMREATESYSSNLGQMTTEIDVTDYNKPVTVAAPPADQTLDLATLMGKK